MKNIILQFDGYLLEEPSENSVWGRVYDVTEPSKPFADVEIFLTTIKEEEKKHIKVGAIFSFYFYDDETSEIIFNKEVWTQEDLDRADAEAKQLSNIFWDLPEAK